jgi:hypothetical protein
MGFGKEVSTQPDFSPLSRNFLLDFFPIGLSRVMRKVAGGQWGQSLIVDFYSLSIFLEKFT